MNQSEAYRIIEEHYRKNAARLMKQTGNEDAVQEAYTRALTYWEGKSEADSWDAWIGIILRNCLRDDAKAEAMRGMVVEPEENSLELAQPSPVNLDYLDVVAQIKKQPENIQHVLYLYFSMGYTSEEISQQTAFKQAHVRKIVQRFRESLE